MRPCRRKRETIRDAANLEAMSLKSIFCCAFRQSSPPRRPCDKPGVWVYGSAIAPDLGTGDMMKASAAAVAEVAGRAEAHADRYFKQVGEIAAKIDRGRIESL